MKLSSKAAAIIIIFVLFASTFLFLSKVELASATTDTIGSTQYPSGSIAGAFLVYPIVASASGNLASIGVNYETAGGNLLVGIYSTYDGSVCSGLIGFSANTATVNGWNDLSVSGVVVSGNTYYIGLYASGGTIYCQLAGAYYVSWSETTFTDPTSALTSGSGIVTNMRIIYAAGPTPTPSPTPSPTPTPAPIPNPSATNSFTDGFEAGNFNKWTSMQYGVAVSSLHTKTGTYSAEFNGSYVQLLNLNINDTQTIALRWWIYLNSSFTSGLINTHICNASGQEITAIKISPNNLGFYEHFPTWVDYNQSYTWNLNTWYCFTWVISRNSSNYGGYSVYVNNDLFYSDSNKDMSGMGTLGIWHLGNWFGEQCSTGFYIDNVAVSDSALSFPVVVTSGWTKTYEGVPSGNVNGVPRASIGSVDGVS